MTKVKDGYFRSISSNGIGSDNYLLKAGGGYIGVGNSNGYVPLSNGTVNTNLNADMTDGLHVHTGRNNEVNKIVRTDANGYIQAGWINTTSGNFTGTPDRIYASNDGYIRYMTPANFFPTLANDSNQLSVTIGGQNRKLTVAYATNSRNSDILNGKLLRSASITTQSAARTIYCKIATVSYSNNGMLFISVGGKSLVDRIYLNYGSGNATVPVICGWKDSNSENVKSIYAIKGSTWNGTWEIWIKIYQATTTSISVYQFWGSCTVNDATDWSATTTEPTYHTKYDVTRGMFGNITGSLTGNASTATSAGKWTTARTLTIGSTGKSVDGSGNVSWSLSEIGAASSGHNHNGTYVKVAGDTMTGTLTMSTNGTGHYDQGIRINRTATSNWALILIGKSGTATSGTGTSTAGDGAWLIGTPASSNSLIFNLNGASETAGLCLKGHGNNDMKWNNNTVWHAGNDGSGSGLDADLLDGTHKADLLTAASLGSSGNSTTISVTVGGTTKTGSVTVPYATSAGNADKLDNYDSTSFEGYYKTTIDASSLDNNTWYPVIMGIGTCLQTRIRIEGRTNAPGAWNSRTDKLMALMLDYTVQGSSWSWISPFRTIYLSQHGAGASGSPNIGNIGQLTNSSTEYIFVRGGAKYDFYLSRPITPVIKTETYTVSSQSVAPTTTAPTAISRTNALISDITWSNLGNKPETATRWPSWSEVTSKPSTFTPSTHNHDDRYYTESESDSRYVNVTGDTMTGKLNINIARSSIILPLDMFTAGMQANDLNTFRIGQSSSTGNSGQFIFKYAGDNNNNNTIHIGFINNYQIFNILNSGNVGIGTTSPSQKLHVSGGLLAITNNSGTLTIGAANESFYHFTGSDSKTFYFSNVSTFNGNVYPYQNNTYKLGTSSNKWKNIYSQAINLYLTGTLTNSGGDKGASANPRYFPQIWTFDAGITPAAGDIVTIKTPSGGHDYGVFLSTNNGTNYYPITLSGTGRLTTHYPSGSCLTLVFDASNSAGSMFALAGQNNTTRVTVSGGTWRVLNYYDSGNPGDWNLRQYTIKAAAAITAAHIIGGTDSGYKNIDAPNAFDIRYAVLYAGSAISSGSTGNNNYIHHYAINLKNSSNGNVTLTAYKNVYIKGTISGTTFTPISGGNPYVQDITTSDDGYVYYYIGRAYSSNALTFDGTGKDIYIYKNGEIKKYSGYSEYSTLSKNTTNLAGGAKGSIPYQSAANTTAMLAIGSANYALVVNSSGLPAWTSAPGLTKTGTVTSITLKAGGGISLDTDNTAITTSGTRTITNSGVRAVTINGNYLRVNTNGTDADLTIPYATSAGKLSTNAGGTEQPVYFSGGVPVSTTYALKATVNNGTANYAAYYSGARAISSTSLIYFDTTNSRVGIGTSSPGYKLTVDGNFTSSNYQIYGSASGTNCNSATCTGIWYYSSNGPATQQGTGSTDGSLWTEAYSDSWVSQTAQDYRTGTLFTRSRNNGTWTRWRTIAPADSDFDMSPIANIVYNPYGRKFTKYAGTNGSWDTHAYSITGYKECRITYKIGQTNAYIMVGLNSDPTTNASYDSIDYCWYTQNGGGLSMYENGSGISSISGHTSYSAGDELIVEYVGGYVRYYHNGVLCREVARSYGTILYFDSSFHNYGNIYDVVFEPIKTPAYAVSSGSAGSADSANHASYLRGPDNRSTNNDPNWYMTNLGAASLYGEFCKTGGANGDYEYRMTMTPWGDNSGQRPVQMAFNNAGGFIRTSASDSSWNNWYSFITSGNIGSQSVSYANSAGYVTGTNTGNWNANDPGNYQYLWYYGQSGGVSNIPSGALYGSVINFFSNGVNSSLNFQLYGGINHDSSSVSQGIWWRGKNNLGWDGSWHRLYDDNYHPSAGYADNADTVDGRHGQEFTYCNWSDNYNCNEVGTHAAVYRFSGSPTNAFPNSSWSNMLVIGGVGSDTATQIGCPYNVQELYFRSGTWYSDSGTIRSASWNRIWHEANDGSGSGLDADTVDGYHAGDLIRSNGGDWHPGANITLNASGSGQEWSFDIYRNGYSSCYWHVWDSSLGTLFAIYPDDGHTWTYGNAYAAHFYENSDIRLKTNLTPILLSIRQISNLPIFDFDWIDKEGRNSGTSAQEVQKILPNIVNENNDYLKLDYGALGTISSIVCARNIVELENEISLLKSEIEYLKSQLNKNGRI